MVLGKPCLVKAKPFGQENLFEQFFKGLFL
jgi:hypothetical protein